MNEEVNVLRICSKCPNCQKTPDRDGTIFACELIMEDFEQRLGQLALDDELHRIVICAGDENNPAFVPPENCPSLKEFP